MANAITISDLTVAYDLKPVLWDIDLDIPEGSLMAIVGPNGAGKSTLLKAMIGLLKPITGKILYKGKPYKKIKKHCAYVPQKESVDWSFPTSVFDVVMMGTYGRLGLVKRPGKKEKEIVKKALEAVGMYNKRKTQISELSGGQKQRVFLARALVQEADILFLDEPFQGVDKVTERELITILRKLNEKGKTIIAVHHDLTTVKEYFTHITLLNLKIIASGEVEKVFTKENIDKAYAASSNL